eukprot:gene10520-7484_t
MEELLVAFIKQPGNGCDVTRITEAMTAQQLSLSDLIEMLELPLTSKDERERNRSTLLIATLLENAALVTATPPVLHLFVVFFCRRLQDFPSISPSLQALTTIVTLYAASLEARNCDVVDIVESVTRSVHVPSYAQSVRQRAFDLLHAMVHETQHVLPQLRVVGGLFLEGVAAVVEGEKDPRCLLRGLHTARRAIAELADHLADPLPDAEAEGLTVGERLFAQLCVYFPIAFRPPPDDPVGVRPEALEAALEDCLCGARAMTRFSVPFFVEQLLSNEAADARVAALRALLDGDGDGSETVLGRKV